MEEIIALFVFGLVLGLGIIFSKDDKDDKDYKIDLDYEDEWI